MVYVLLAIVLIFSFIFLVNIFSPGPKDIPSKEETIEEKKEEPRELTLKDKAKQYVSKRLRSIAKVFDGYLYNDVSLKEEKTNETHLIDHLLLTNSGIYLIDTYGFIGEIRGKLKKESWEAISDEGKLLFPNPIKMMERKRNYVSKVFQNGVKLRICSYIVFIADDISKILCHPMVQSIKSLERLINRETYRGRYSSIDVDMINGRILRILKKESVK